MGLEQGDDPPSAPMDFTSVVVKYDDVAGRVEVSYVFAEVPQDQDLRAGRLPWLRPARRRLQRADVPQPGFPSKL